MIYKPKQSLGTKYACKQIAMSKMAVGGVEDLVH